jgi:flagellar basal-body rod protein FlgB
VDFQGKALVLRADRQRTIASNIANADTPGYAARDFQFGEALRDAAGAAGAGHEVGTLRMAAPASGAPLGAAGGRTDPRHIPLGGGAAGTTGVRKDYTVQIQPSMDGNTVDMDRERAAFTDNAVRYEATLRFINGSAKTILAAIQGQ